MPPELLALIDNPVLLVLVLFAGAMIGIYVFGIAIAEHTEQRIRWFSYCIKGCAQSQRQLGPPCISVHVVQET